MSSQIVVWVVSKSKLAEFQAEPEGLTWGAHRIVGKEGPLPEGIARCRIGASGLVDADRRYGERARGWIEKLLGVTPYPSPAHEALSLALEFYRPLLPGPDALNDSGHKETLGPVISSERCRALLGHWQSASLDQFRCAVDDYIGVWEPVRPPVNFKNGGHLVEYLGCYAQALEEAVRHDSFYVSFYL